MLHQTKNVIVLLFFFFLNACGTTEDNYVHLNPLESSNTSITKSINSPGEKLIVVDPRAHSWAAYSANGSLMRSGLASAGADWCNDMQQSCRTNVGTFRIRSLGSSSCVSPSFPLPHGGAPMPYCMYFTQDQALHGSYNVVNGNISHGCVRLHVNDAQWLRYNFAEAPSASNGYQGTLVMIKPY